MNTFPVIKNLDVFKDVVFYFFHCIIPSAIETFSFCGGEKTFDTRVIIGAARLAHGRNDVVLT